MNVEEIEIFTGKPTFDFAPIRRLEVKCEATNALMPAPTIEEANGRLRALAAKVGANTIVEVEYKSGVSFTSWKSLKAIGIAGTRASDEVACDVCAETIKRAALKCRYCGADRKPAEMSASHSEAKPANAGVALPLHQEPLRDNNNPVWIISAVILGLFLVGAFLSSIH